MRGLSLGGDYEENHHPGHGVMHSDRSSDVSEGYAAFLLTMCKSLHSLPLNSENDET